MFVAGRSAPFLGRHWFRSIRSSRYVGAYFNSAAGQNARFNSVTIDGVRVEYADGFGLARPSNTTPVVVLRFEADNQAAIERIQADFRRAIEGVWPGVQLPF